MIHSTSTPVTTIPEESKFFVLYVFLNVFSKFAVPVFIFLSGFVLFYNYINKDLTKKMVIGFYKKRIIQIVIPYIFFSIFYYAVLQLAQTKDIGMAIDNLLSVEFLKAIFIGKAYTHLYYIFIIVQFYLLFPIMLWIFKKKPGITRHLIWIGIVLQWSFIIFNAEVWQYPYKGSIAFSYILYFLVGAYLGIYYDRFKHYLKLSRDKFSAVIPIVWLIWLAATGAHIYLYYHVFGFNSYVAPNYVFEIVMQLHATTASIVILQFSFWIYHRWSADIVNPLINLGALSFGVYLLHPFFLLLYRRIPLSGDSVVFHLWSAGGFLVALFVTWGIVWWMGKYIKFHWIAFGPIPQKLPYRKKHHTYDNNRVYQKSM